MLRRQIFGRATLLGLGFRTFGSTASLLNYRLNQINGIVASTEVGDADAIKSHIGWGADPNTLIPGSPNDFALLHRAAQEGYLSAVQTLLACGADANLLTWCRAITYGRFWWK